MLLFDERLPFFKGNTHMHTTCSDGRLSPQDAIARYARAGYDFIALTDHRTVSPERIEQGVLVLSGVELDYRLDVQVVHITGLGLREPFDAHAVCQPGMGPEDGIAAIRAAGGRAILAHPAWSLNTLSVLPRLRGVSALEIFNSVSQSPWNGDRAESASFSDLASTAGAYLPVVCADDAHFYDGDECQSFICVNAPACTREALLDALDAGRFYASRGPRIEQVEVANGRVVVRTSPARRVIFYSNLVWTDGRCVQGSGMREAAYALQRGDRFVRVEVVDEAGRKAYLSPIALD